MKNIARKLISRMIWPAHPKMAKELAEVLRLEDKWIPPIKALKLVFSGRVDRDTYRRRLETCARCAIFSKGLNRCGTSPKPEIGCGCHMPTKAKFRDSECWNDENEWSQQGLENLKVGSWDMAELDYWFMKR